MGQLRNNEIPANRAALNQRTRPYVTPHAGPNVAEQMRGIISQPLVVPRRPHTAFPKIAAILVVLLVGGAVAMKIAQDIRTPFSSKTTPEAKHQIHNAISQPATQRVYQSNSTYRNTQDNGASVPDSDRSYLRLQPNAMRSNPSSNQVSNGNFGETRTVPDQQHAATSNTPSTTSPSLLDRLHENMPSTSPAQKTAPPPTAYANSAAAAPVVGITPTRKSNPYSGTVAPDAAQQHTNLRGNHASSRESQATSPQRRADESVPLLPSPSIMNKRNRK